MNCIIRYIIPLLDILILSDLIKTFVLRIIYQKAEFLVLVYFENRMSFSIEFQKYTI